MAAGQKGSKYATLSNQRTNVWETDTCWPIKITLQQKTKVAGCMWT